MLELINRARANGEAEATRLQLAGGLQEGSPGINGEVTVITNTVQPLSWSPLLLNAAQGHAERLNTGDQFFSGQNAHTFGGTDPDERIAAAGYPMNEPQDYFGAVTTPSGFRPGPENVASVVATGTFFGRNLGFTVLAAHNALFIDKNIAGRGHRLATMSDFWREIGVGISIGTDVGQGNTWNSVYLVQNFGSQTSGTTFATPFITGVVYDDRNGNGLYTPGEGVGGVRVDVTGANYFAVSASAGGYSVPVPGNGTYTVTFSGGGQPTQQRTVTVTNLNVKVDFVVNVAAPAPDPTVLANISTRLLVETGDNVLIAGFIVTGTQSKKVIVRAIGPSLSSFFAGTLGNPTLELRDGTGALLASNDDWKTSGFEDRQAIIDSSLPPTDDLESAIVATLPANGAGYTAVVRGANNSTGIAVVEVYDLDQTADSKLANISTRGFVQPGDPLIGGMIVLGPGPQKVIVRAIGPSLNGLVPGTLSDPTLELRDSNGTVVRANDNWRTGGQQQEIIDWDCHRRMTPRRRWWTS
ncbi:MAG: CAP domain-containing protein [Chthoniobacterales bacterium]